MMAQEHRVKKLEGILNELVTHAGGREYTSIYPGAEVINNVFSADRIIVRGRDGYYEPALKVPGATYNNGDLVTMLYVKGTEPVAMQQSPGSAGGGGGGYPYNRTTVDLVDGDADYASLDTAFGAEPGGTEFQIGPGAFTLTANGLPDGSHLIGNGQGIDNYITGFATGGLDTGLPFDGDGYLQHIRATLSSVNNAAGIYIPTGSVARLSYSQAYCEVNGGGLDSARAVYLGDNCTCYIRGGVYESNLIAGAMEYGIYANGAGTVVYLEEVPTILADNPLQGSGNFYGVYQDANGLLWAVFGAYTTATPIGMYAGDPKADTITVGGAVTYAGHYMTVDTNGFAANDDLDTINVGVALEGDLLIFRALNSARTVVVKHNTGNIWIPSGNDITLDDAEDHVMLIYSGTLAKWCVINVFSTGGGAWPLSDDKTADTSGSADYLSVALGIVGAADGQSLVLNSETYTESSLALTKSLTVYGRGNRRAVIQSNGSGSNWSVMSVSGVAKVHQLMNLQLLHNNAGANDNTAALISANANSHESYAENCIFDATGGGGALRAHGLYLNGSGGTKTYKFHNCYFKGNGVAGAYGINAVGSDTYTLTIEGGEINDALLVNNATATVILLGPRITGTVTITAGTVQGWYYDSNRNFRSALGNDIYPNASAQGLNARFERLFGDDLPTVATAYQRNPFLADDAANNRLGFLVNTAASADSYNPPAPFSKSNTGAVYFYVLSHHLIVNSLAGTARLIWTSATAKSVCDLIMQMCARVGAAYGGEIRAWGVQAPGAGDNYWAARFIIDSATYPDWPWRVQLWTGTGTTFAVGDGTLRQDALWDPFNAQYVRFRVLAGPMCHLEIGGIHSQIAVQPLNVTLAGQPTSIKTLNFYVATSYQQAAIDSINMAF